MPHGRTASQEQKLRTALAKGFREGGLLWCQCCPMRGREPHLWTAMHERLTRGRGGDPCDERNIVLLCDDCHRHVHSHSNWATENGFLESAKY